ncbi:hypothetical protein QU926_18300 [Pseudomonas asiatica]|uniref:hypothetical protein n=1 Tax=Pseudomonas asiatica TaxID=2219225 RepID=UPI0025AB191E|nr:hypothetical protein [Pseudomonas asiatica]MDM9555576.1 hypothetical protein [Pseudomonas asiatica]
MTASKVFWICLTAASFAFLGGVASGALSTSTALSCRIVGQTEDQHPPPPAGDQFDEGPVLARLPVTQLYPVRFIF